MSPTKSLLAATLFITTAVYAAPNQIPSAFHGTWAETKAICLDEDGIGTFYIDSTDYEGYESSCSIKKVTQATPKSFTGTFKCNDDYGAPAHQKHTFTITTSGKLSIDQQIPLMRCKAK